MSATPKSPYDVVVLGAGGKCPLLLLTTVIGLATADALTEAGLRVAMLARDLPEDTDSAAFASPWAGANWSSFAVTDAERRRDTVTFKAFERLSTTHPSLVRRTPFVYVWDEDGGYGNPWYRDVVYNVGLSYAILTQFRPLDKSEIPTPYTAGITFEAWTINPPKFCAYLAGRLRSRGVPIVRRRVASLDEAFSAFGPVDLVVNATALGSQTLLGVQDAAVHPVRGQTVLVRAPSVTTVYGVRDKKLPKSEAVYVIPRPGTDGCVILGGTNLRDDYSTLPRAETAERILRNCHAICPELGKTWKDIEIVSHNVGLRPARDGGFRCEIEEKSVGGGEMVPMGGRGAQRKAAVLHCYGSGSTG